MQRAVWISFDLGVRGDYQGMYAWLDNQEAKECGDNLAYVNYQFEGDLVESLVAGVKAAVDVTKKTRIYAIWQDPESRKMKGRFIFGGRKAPPWTGYGQSPEQSVPDEG